MKTRMIFIVIFLFVGHIPVYSSGEELNESLDLLNEAQKFIDSDRNEEAINLLNDFIIKYPSSAEIQEVRLQLAILLANTDEDKSKAEFQSIIENHYESSQALEALYHLGYIHFKSGEIDDASVCYSLLISRSPNPLLAAGSVASRSFPGTTWRTMDFSSISVRPSG